MQPSRLSSSGTLSDRVVTYLLDYTRKHRLKSGEEVPSEGTLSSELKVSRGVVREAYRSLKTAGVLDIANGRAPRIGRINNQAITQLLHHALYSDQATPLQLLDVRRSLEVRAAELAASHRTDDDARALRRAAETMAASTGQRRRFVNADLRFHGILGRATGNPLFALLTSALRESLDVTIRAGFDGRHSRAEHDRVAHIHLDLADAIACGQAAKARRLMTVHFKEAATYVAPPGRRTSSPAPRRRADVS